MKKNAKIILFFLAILSIASCKKTPNIKENGMFAVFNTNMGNFTCKLFYDKVPVTVGNFVALVEGDMEFTDPKTSDKVKKRYYDGLIFHRIIDGFMIQGGDILGTGYGGPGYSFIDEFDSSLKHESEGILSMANAGPDTNGSQFFITLVPTPHLDGRHAVFGKVTEGMEVVREIGKVKVDQNDRPYKEVFIKNIEIVRTSEEAKAFNAMAAFGKQEEILKKREAEKNVPNYPPQGSNKTNRFWAEKINKDKQHKNDYKDTKDETTPPNINKGIGRNKKGGEVKKSCGGSPIVAKFKAKCGTKMKKHQQGGSLNRNPFHLEFLKSVKN